MLQLYGNPRSRAMRCLWMLEEMGEPYQLIEKSTRTDELQSAEYLRLNPNARIPTLVDGDVVLWESMAINLYLAQKYEGPMHCVSPEVLGLAAQWSFWAMLEMEGLLLDLMQHRAVLPEFARDASYAERDELLLRKAAGGTQQHLDCARPPGGRQLYCCRPQCCEHPCLGQNGALGPVGSLGCETMAGQLFGAACLQSSA